MSVYHDTLNNFRKQQVEEIANNYNSNLSTIWQSYYSVVISSFEWENIPEWNLIFHPEEFLTYWGQFCFFKDRDEYKILPCYNSGKLLGNGLYDRYVALEKNGVNHILSLDDIELCFNNSLRLGSIYYVSELADKASFALSAVDSALWRAQISNIISCENQNQQTAIEQILSDKKSSLKPFFVANAGKFDEIKNLNIFDNKQTDINTLWESYIKYKNMFMTYFGVYNIEMQKNERLTEAESVGNQDRIRYSLLSDMNANRQDFCKRVKKHFDYEILCKPNRSTPVTLEEIKNHLLLNKGFSDKSIVKEQKEMGVG